MAKRPYSEDPIEKIVREALDRAGITYLRDAPLDFECGDFAIEVKQFHSERAIRQLAGRTDVILIQGRAAANAFARLVGAVGPET